MYDIYTTVHVKVKENAGRGGVVLTHDLKTFCDVQYCVIFHCMSFVPVLHFIKHFYIFSVQFTRRKTNSIFYLHPLNRQLKTKMKWLKEICFVQIFKMKKCIYDHVTKFDTMIRICIVEIAINLRYNVLWIWINNIFFCILFNVYALRFGHSNVCISL